LTVSGSAIKVCASLKNKETREIEINGLLEALEVHELKQGLIITEDETDSLSVIHNSKKYQINIVPCWQWVLEAEK